MSDSPTTVGAPEIVAPEGLPLALVEAALLVGPDDQRYRDALERNVAAFEAGDAEAFVDEFIGARWPDYRPSRTTYAPPSS